MEKPNKLRGHLLYLAEIGGDPEKILEGSGISLDEIMGLQLIDNSKMAELFALLDARTPVDFAIRCGLAIKFQYMGILGYRLINSDTVRDIIDTWIRYSVVIGYPLFSDLVIGEDEWQFRFWPRYALNANALRLCMETTVAGAAPALRALSGHPLPVLRYGFPFSCPVDCAHFALLGDIPVQFDQAYGYIAGRLDDLPRRIAAIDNDAKAMTEDYCQNWLSMHVSKNDIPGRLKAIFARQPGELPSAAMAARQLGCSERTLHRRLAAVNCNYQRLADLHRRDTAVQLLEQAVETKVIAYRLGYQDTGSFRRAFRHWTGMSPSEWRNANRVPEMAAFHAGPQFFHPGDDVG